MLMVSIAFLCYLFIYVFLWCNINIKNHSNCVNMKKFLSRIKNLQVSEHKVLDEDGMDVTPKPLSDPYVNKTLPAGGFFSPYSSLAKTPSIQGSEKSTEQPQALSDSGSIRLEGLLRARKPSRVVDSDVKTPQEPPPKVSVKLTLKETDTSWLLEMPSTALAEDDPEVSRLHEQIQRYDWLTKGKGKNRKMVDAETQTLNLPAKGKATMTTPILTQNVESYVSAWDLYDTFEKIEGEDGKVVGEAGSFPERREDAYPITDVDSFLQSAMVMERLLAGNNFQARQAMFKAFPPMAGSPERATRFQYELYPLWVYKCGSTQGKAVITFSWNSSNSELLAVGYGTFLLTDDRPRVGLVCCWSTKNPNQPERTFPFVQPVTALAFSAASSRVLAVGQQDGKIVLMDVASRHKEPFCTSGSSSRQHAGPVWKLTWNRWNPESAEELLMSTGEDGQICRWTMNNDFYCIDGMKLPTPALMTCIDSLNGTSACCDAPVQKFLSGLDFSLSLTEHPPTIYVSTKEGYLLEVEAELKLRRLSKVHCGPVFCVQTSPFCPQLLLTAGADGRLRLWVRASDKPLMDLEVSDGAVLGASWSPSHSTIVATLSGPTLSLWDIGRKTHEPVSTVQLDDQLTALAFSPSGKNLLAGDRNGNVHVYSLQDMPYPPCMQVEALTRAVPGLKSYLTADLNN